MSSEGKKDLGCLDNVMGGKVDEMEREDTCQVIENKGVSMSECTPKFLVEKALLNAERGLCCDNEVEDPLNVLEGISFQQGAEERKQKLVEQLLGMLLIIMD
jgi:hypothetical protein